MADGCGCDVPKSAGYSNFNFKQKKCNVARELIILSQNSLKMAVTRSSSAKKVVRKAVAVKITRLSSSAAVKVTREYLTWDERFTQLVDYKNEHGHCNPKQNTKLGLWCKSQRKAFKENKLRHYQMNNE
jgi:hypothetical protein